MKKRCLLILSRFPYPPVGGDRLKSYHLLKQLSTIYDVTAVIITEESEDEMAEDFLRKVTIEYRIFKLKKITRFLNLCRSIINNKPLQVNLYNCSAARAYINSAILEQDFLISTLVRTADFLIDIDKFKILDMVDSISMNYQRSISKTSSFFWKLIYKFEVTRLQRYELQCVTQFNYTTLVNKEEARYWGRFGKCMWIPNGISEELLTYDNVDNIFSDSLVFFGKMDYQPNIDAVLWFIDKVYPKLKAQYKLIILGSNPSKIILSRAKQSKRITVTGYLDDPYIILKSCKAVIAPMQTGGGIQNKILEAMALGKIVVTTTLGAEPIVGAHHSEHLLVADTPAEFASAVEDIYNNNISQNLSFNAKHLMSNNYTWSNYLKRVKEIVNSCNI